MTNKEGIKKVSYLTVASDFFHYGHFNAIKFAKSISEYLICGVLITKDIIPEREEALTTLEERKEFLSNINFVDKVVTQYYVDPTENLKQIKQDFPNAEIILVHDPDLKRVLGLEYVKKIGGQAIPHPDHARISIHKKINILGNSKEKQNRQRFIHAWGGTTSIQSLECHTLRYVKFPYQLANHITGKIFCEIRNKHHTVYFDEKDIQLWNKEGLKLLDIKEQKKIIQENLDQIKRFFSFYEGHKNLNCSAKTNRELFNIYDKLLYLVMENGSFFPYSREDATNPIKEKILSLLAEKKDKLQLFQILTTPTKKDIFLDEMTGRRNLLKQNLTSKEDLWEHAKKHPWRFINTYSKEAICKFLSQELSNTNLDKLEKEIQLKISKNKKLKKEQREYFEKADSTLLKDLCLFLQDIAVIRLKNKHIWAGYELLFLGLFQEIAKRLGLSIDDYLASYRIDDTKAFLKTGKKLPLGEVEKRKTFFILEISNSSINYSYTPKLIEKISNLPKDSLVLKGESGNIGKVVGRALVVTEDNIDSLMKTKKETTPNDIYITTMTHPAMVSILHDVNGIITDEGGVTSHASIISRELGIPCLVATRDATRFFKTGDIIELDSYNQRARKLTKEETEEYQAVKKGGGKESSNGRILKIHRPVPDPSMPYLIGPVELGEKDFSIGGKAKNLSKVYKIYNVPEYFCLTRRVFDKMLNEILDDALILDTNNIDKFKEILRGLGKSIKNYKFDDRLTNDILKQVHSLNCEYVAIRSSASCEDSAKNSFAGQFQTFLGVPEEKVISGIKECIASAFKENVVFYFLSSRKDFSDFYMSVIVQQFLPCQKAGVFFSENLSDPLKKAFCINANFGVGESVVSGETEPDTYLIDREGNISSFISKNKKVYNYNKGKLVISNEKKRVLNNDEIQQLTKLGKSLLELYDTKIEYEWCFSNNSLYLLQVRPITAKLKNINE